MIGGPRAARCNRHQDRTVFPSGCPTCTRIELEASIVKRTVGALLDAGYALFIDGQGDDNRPERPTRSRAAILAELQETDDDYLMCFHADRALPDSNGRYTADGWVRFVYGNDGYDVISDYTTNLESVLAPINAYTDSIS